MRREVESSLAGEDVAERPCRYREVVERRGRRWHKLPAERRAGIGQRRRELRPLRVGVVRQRSAAVALMSFVFSMPCAPR